MMKKLSIAVTVFIFIVGCATSKRNVQKKIGHTLDSEFYAHQFTGFLLIDPATNAILHDHNSEKYFTPASNTKIFSLFTAVQLLPDSLPALKYLVQHDTLFVEGTGDPTPLHPYFMDSTAIHFLKSHKTVAQHFSNFQMNRYGPGWAWEDYDRYYSPERSGMPIYGNLVSLHKADSLWVTPSFFKKNVIPIAHSTHREERFNTFYFEPARKDTLEVPFITGDTLTKKLWEEAIGKKIHRVATMPPGEKKLLYSVPSDSVYQRMMFESDNFLAEQLLILASSTLSDTLDGTKAQRYILAEYLADLKQPPRWVDGSGLSRYNLFSPESMVQVLNKMYQEIPRERLFNFFPTNGLALKNNEKTYCYAKSGSLGNNYCYSGYLIAKSGKILIFSFMNNHFTGPNTEVKNQMEHMLQAIRDAY